MGTIFSSINTVRTKITNYSLIIAKSLLDHGFVFRLACWEKKEIEEGGEREKEEKGEEEVCT